MKFGGSSVADAPKIRRVADRAIARRRQGNRVVVVVSAPGDMTDDLLELASGVTPHPDERELDMLLATGEQAAIALLCMAIKARGHDAISFTGPQAGIYADHRHTRARITQIRPEKVREQLSRGRIVVVAGFQGLNPNQDIATLGRGGSDLTAIALAAALRADRCEIYTDVEGVYTTDPRVVPAARRLPQISYDELLELAGSGAQVMQGRAIEVAKKYGVLFEVRSTFVNTPGTRVSMEVPRPSTKLRRVSMPNLMEEAVVSGIALDRKQAKLSVLDVPDQPGVAARLFGALAQVGINVDMIIQSAARERVNDISFTIARGDVKRAVPVLQKVRRALRARGLLVDEGVAKVAVVGVGMRSHAGVAARMFEILGEAKINIQMISTSEIKISCVVRESHVDRAVRVLHKAFKLGKP